MSLKFKIRKKLRNQEKPGENLKNQFLVPGDFLARRKVKKPGFSWLNQEVWHPCIGQPLDTYGYPHIIALGDLRIPHTIAFKDL
jgi:hypothetical protein